MTRHADRTPEQLARTRARAQAIRDASRSERQRLAQIRSVERQKQRKALEAAGIRAPIELETPEEQERIRRDIAELSTRRRGAVRIVPEGDTAAELAARAEADAARERKAREDAPAQKIRGARRTELARSSMETDE